MKNFLTNLVKSASELITPDFIINSKGIGGDLVTDFDYKIEKYIIEQLKSNYPSYDIISEEFNENVNLTENCFTIDPIDGTINFAHGLPFWGIQIACIENYKTTHAIIYLPELNELFYADESGAYLNDKKINVNNLPKEKCLYSILEPISIELLTKAKKELNLNRNFYCAAIEFCYTACGRMGGYLFTKDTAWDYIPGQFIVKQAGGVVLNDKGKHIAANSNDMLEFLSSIAD